MSSVIAICNLALSNIGKDNINALNEGSAEALACNQFYNHALDLLLQSFPWRFAGKTVALAEIGGGNARWKYRYQRPNDCLKVRWIYPHYDDGDCYLSEREEVQIPYAVEGGHILTGLSPAWLRYTARVSDPSLFPPLFTDAFAWQLSVRLAMPLTRDSKVRAEAYQLAQEMTSMAREADANETRANSDFDSALVAGRNHG